LYSYFGNLGLEAFLPLFLLHNHEGQSTLSKNSTYKNKRPETHAQRKTKRVHGENIQVVTNHYFRIAQIGGG
jgi:hypothetical protein